MRHFIREDIEFMFQRGVTVLVDGQYGSTGKGVIAARLGELFWGDVDLVISNAGPNSGHTFFDGGGKKHVLKQLPSFAVSACLAGAEDMPVFLSGGAVIDPEILGKEIDNYQMREVRVHPNAAVIDAKMRSRDTQNRVQIASTGQGVGPAIIRKLMRRPDDKAVMDRVWSGNDSFTLGDLGPITGPTFMEISQGYSLGVNSGMWPHVTTRECTVSQGFADAGLPPPFFSGCIMSVRTYPIRVGSTFNTSGPCYPDQEEITWEQLGQEPEMTTVTQRVRRVFTWSRWQFMAAVTANAPEVIFVNFCNYLKTEADAHKFVREYVVEDYHKAVGTPPSLVLMGFGPLGTDIKVWEQ